MSDGFTFKRFPAGVVATMMIVSVITVGVGFTGSTIAQQTELEVSSDDTTIPDTVEPGTTFNLSYTVENTGSNATGAILDVDIPEGWNATNEFDDSGSYKTENQSWLWQTINASETKSPTLMVYVPPDASNTSYNISADVKTSAGTVDTITNTVTVDSDSEFNNSSGKANVTLSAPNSVSPGENFNASFTIENTGSNETGMILDAALPDSWTATNISDDGGAYSAVNRSWLWQTVNPGETKSTSLTIAVPENATNATLDIAGVAKLSDGIAGFSTQLVTVEADGDTSDTLTPFDKTSPIPSNRSEPSSLGGKIRVENRVLSDTSVSLNRNTSDEYSVDLTVDDEPGEVTFYLQEQAVSASQDIENLQMFLDGQPRDFDVVSPSGNSPWIAFTVPHFSTRTVTFSSDSNNETQVGSAPFISSPLEDTYNSSEDFTLSTSYNASGVIDQSDLAIRIVNTTAGNSTEIAQNTSVPIQGLANTTIPAGSLSGNVTIEAQLYNISSESSAANTTVTLTDTTDSTSDDGSDGGTDDGTDETDDGTDDGNSGGGGGSDGDNTTVTAAFSFTPSNPEAGESITFDASDSTADAGIADYTWDFDQVGGGTVTTDTALQPTTYDDRGDYEVTLTVTDTEGRTATVTKTVSVAESTDDSTPGFGSPIALLAVTAFSLLIGRRRVTSSAS